MLPLHYNALNARFNKQTRIEMPQGLSGIGLLRLTPNNSVERWQSL